MFRKTTVISLCLVALGYLAFGSQRTVAYALQDGNPFAVLEVEWSPDGTALAVGYADHTVRILDGISGQRTKILRGANENIGSLAWKPDGSQIIGGGRTTAWVWDVNSGQLLATLPDIGYVGVDAVTWTLDSSQIHTYAFDYGIYKWDAITYQLIISGGASTVVQIVWNSDKSQVAMAASSVVIIADPITFRPELEVLHLDNYPTTSVTWNPVEPYIASGNYAGDVRVWDTVTGELLHTLRATDTLPDERRLSIIWAIHFSADGSKLASLTADGTFRTWDSDTGTLLQSETLSGAPIYAAAFSPDGTKLAYGGESGILKIITLEP